jgi:hypothetical protein
MPRTNYDCSMCGAQCTCEPLSKIYTFNFGLVPETITKPELIARFEEGKKHECLWNNETVFPGQGDYYVVRIDGIEYTDNPNVAWFQAGYNYRKYQEAGAMLTPESANA